MTATEPPYARRLLSKTYLAAWLHVGLFMLVLRYGEALLPEARNPAQEERAREYTLQSERAWSQQRIDDLEEVKRQLDAMARDPESDNAPAEESSQQPPPESIEEMYEQARELLADIEAQEKVLLDEQPASASRQAPVDSLPDEAGHGGLTETEMADRIGEMQGQAREALARVQRRRAAGSEQAGSESSDNAGVIDSAGDFDPGNRLATESHFNQHARGTVNDVSEQMRQLYQAQELGARVSPTAVSADTKPPASPRNSPVSFGRRIATRGRAVGWLALDSWYFIGPFPNKARVNLETQFPPEHDLNLDALYLGNDRRVLRWQHVEYDQLPLLPPEFSEYAVYYAYTEVFSDEPRNVWLAIGSDDQSKLWVNGVLVWRSIDLEKPWQPDEGYRKIRLKRGANRFLFRLENGIQRAAMSVMLRAAD